LKTLERRRIKMEQADITTDNSLFVLLSFEGPDLYSLAGGLGARITNLSQALANRGFPTHLFFIGDPRRDGEETTSRGRLVLHRWCQWISEYYPNGVYQGEDGKVNDFKQSLPPFVIERLIKPALAEDKLVVILSEEWHTAEAACRLSEQLRGLGLRDKVVMFWNANNTFGFNRIDWPRLANNTTITTVSHYMKRIMREKGVNPLVIPNGIPEPLLGNVDNEISVKLRKQLKADFLLTKVARYDATKGWNQAVEAMARLNRNGKKAVLLARGGIEPYGEEVMYNARHLGLNVEDVVSATNHPNNALEAISSNHEAEVLNVKFHCVPELLRILYHASDAVLANSSHEPFGLVGLETMAAGGIAFTGGTGEDYAIHLYNSIVLETPDPREIETYVTYLDNHAEQEEKIRRSAHNTARQFTWEEVIKNLIEKIVTRASIQGIIKTPARPYVPQPEAWEFPQTAPVSQAVPAAVS
jgi:glycosyltransferase involved in cell wall biosynthesis